MHGYGRIGWGLLALVLLFTGCSAGSEETVYEVRGRYVGPAYGGQAAVVDHERIPGYMDVMRMTLKLDDPAAADGLERGAAIRFELVVTEDDSYVRALEVLPAETEMELAGEAASAAPEPP